MLFFFLFPPLYSLLFALLDTEQSDISGILESIRDKCFKKAAAAEAREKKEKPDKPDKPEKAEKVAKAPKFKTPKGEKSEGTGTMVYDENARSCIRMRMDGKQAGEELGVDGGGESAAEGVGISHADAADFFSDAFPLSPCPLSPRMQMMIEKHFCSSSSFSSSSSASTSSSSHKLFKIESGK